MLLPGTPGRDWPSRKSQELSGMIHSCAGSKVSMSQVIQQYSHANVVVPFECKRVVARTASDRLGYCKSQANQHYCARACTRTSY